MGLFDTWPYTNFHELNLTWLLRRMQQLTEVVENFVALNTIKYADPIQWNITTQYEPNTVVIDPVDGTAYISVKPVPAGVSLTNTDYWSVIFTLDVISANKNITLRDDGSNILATFTSAAGDWLIWNGTLYKVSQNININEAYVPGYNIDRYTVELFIRDYIADILDQIGDLTNLTTADKSNLVNAINEILTITGDLTNLTTTDKSNLVNAINEVLTVIGDITTLTTTDKTDIVSAINEINSKNNNLMIYNVRDYGAVGDNVTDDTAALQAAAAAVNTTGGILYFPPGTYTTTQTLVITHNGTILRGAAPNNSYIMAKDDITAVQFLGDSGNIKSGCGIQDLGLTCQSVTPNSHYGVDIEYGVNDFFKNVIIGGFKKGVYAVHVGNTFFEACGVVSTISGAIGFDIGDRSVSIASINCYVGFSGAAVDNGIGYLANRGDIADFTLKYFDVGNGGYGVFIDGDDSPAQYPPADIRLYDVVTDGCRIAGIRVQNINEQGSIEISGGWFNEQTNCSPNAVCISLDNANHISIHDCTLQQLKNEVSTISGVAVNVGTHLNIVNNKFINILRPISLNSTDRSIVTNNMITSYTGITNASYAISLTGAYENTVVANQIYTGYITGVNSTSGDYNIITNNIIRGPSTDISDSSTHSIILNNLPNSNKYQFIDFGVSSARPVNPVNGQMFFDNSIGMPIWRKNSVWVKADGTSA